MSKRQEKISNNKQENERKKQMKTMCFALYFFIIISICKGDILPGQPNNVARNQYGQWFTLVEVGEPSEEGYWGVTVSHWHPFDGAIYTFGDGVNTAKVSKVIEIRGGYFEDEFDLSFIKLDRKISIAPNQVIWHMLPELEDYGTITVRGFGLDGWFVGINTRLLTNWGDEAPEYYQGVFYNVDPPGTIRPGYSGAPVWFGGDKLLCVNFGATGDSPDYYGGVGNPIFLVLEKYPENFPKFLQPPTKNIATSIETDGNNVVVTVKSRNPNQCEIQFSSDLVHWEPVANNPRLIEFKQNYGPWKTIATVSRKSGGKEFFRGIILNEEVEKTPKSIPARRKVLVPPKITPTSH